MSIRRGELFYANLYGLGSVQNGFRPVLVYSNNANNKHAPTLNVIPLTTENKELCVHVKINGFGLMYESVALVEQLTTIDKSQLGERIGKVDQECLCKIDEAMDIQLGRTKKTEENPFTSN